MKITIRSATKADMEAVHTMVVELAVYEKALKEVITSAAQFRRDGFGRKKCFEVLLAEADGTPAGMAFYYFCYSTWKGKMLYLDDIIVKEKYRKTGIGKKLFDAVLHAAKANGAMQVRFHVLDWNKPAIRFYKKSGVKFDREWITCKIDKLI